MIEPPFCCGYGACSKIDGVSNAPPTPSLSPQAGAGKDGRATGSKWRVRGMIEAEAAELAGFGVEPGWGFAIRHRVRWSECDPFGHANHRAYFEWFEEARNRYLEAVGLPALSAATPGPVMAETGAQYHRPLAYGDEVLVTARTVRLGRTSFEMEYAVWRRGLCAQGRAALILVVNATGEKTPLPDPLRRAMLTRDPGAREAGRNERASE